MKTFMKYFLVCIASVALGGVLGWQAFSYKIRSRVVPFDREHFRNHHFDFYKYAPSIDFHFSPTGNTFHWGENIGETEEDLDSHLARFANFTTSCFVASFNRDVTVQQVRDMDSRIRKYGFRDVKMLIEDNRDNRTGEEERLFSEIRVGPSKDFYWHQVEWEVDVAQEEATERMKRKKGG